MQQASVLSTRRGGDNDDGAIYAERVQFEVDCPEY
jgi:hypothetical protein